MADSPPVPWWCVVARPSTSARDRPVTPFRPAGRGRENWHSSCAHIGHAVTHGSPQPRRSTAHSLATRDEEAARRKGGAEEGERESQAHPAQRNRGVIDMPTVKKSIEVDVPVTTAYDQWTQFEEFPRFMEG